MKRIILTALKPVTLILTLSLLLSACATQQAAPDNPGVKIPLKERQTDLNKIHSWNLNGKIGVQTAQDSGSASVKWYQRQNNYTLSLLGPMGAGAMTLTGKPGFVSLSTADGKHYTASSPEALLAKSWGYHLPVSYMNYWIRGLPAPSSNASTHYDRFNRLSSMQQQGWTVQYLGYTKTSLGDLPNRMMISSANLKVKIVVYSWQVT